MAKQRSKMVKQLKAGAVDRNTLATFAERSAHPLHSPTQPLGITCLAGHPTSSNLLLTGGADGVAHLFDTDTQQITQTYRGHEKAVTSVKYVAESQRVLTTSTDHTANLYHATDSTLVHTFRTHKHSVTAGDVHPTLAFAITASADHSWAWHDLTTLSTPTIVRSVHLPYTTAKFHPDGVLIGTGTSDGVLRIWDVRELKVAATLEHSTADDTAANGTAKQFKLTDIAFNPNGYIVATSDRSGCISVYDLRKPAAGAMHTIELSRGSEVNAIAYDESGSYLGAASSTGTAIYESKTFDAVVEWQSPQRVNGVVLRLQQGEGKKPYVATASKDRKLLLYGAPTAAA
jgi:pre-mRNA-processing factor 19